MKEKIYESYGLKFGISKFARPGTADCIWFTQGQYDYLKDNKATREEFEYLWKMKKADWAFDFIPPEAKTEPLKLANKYLPDILAILKPPVIKSPLEVQDETNINSHEPQHNDGRS